MLRTPQIHHPFRRTRKLIAALVIITFASTVAGSAAAVMVDPDVASKAASDWVLTSNTARTDVATDVAASFVAPADGTYVLNVEVWDVDRKKQLQKSETQTLDAGQSAVVHLAVPLDATSAGEYSIRQGVWTKGWAKKLAGVWFTGSFDSDPSWYVAPTTTTTEPPTTTTEAPTTTTEAPTTTTEAPVGDPVIGETATDWSMNSSVYKSASAVIITANYYAPTTVNDTFAYNLEVWNSAYKKAFQKSEKLVASRGSRQTVSLSIPLQDFAADDFTVRQGVWTSDWSAKKAGLDQTGAFSVTASEISSAAPVPTTTTTTPPPVDTNTVWNLRSITSKSSSSVNIVATYKAPASTSGYYSYNLEIWNSAKKKAFQKSAKLMTANGGTNTVSYAIPLNEFTAGEFTVRQGVWTSDWVTKQAGLDLTGEFAVSAAEVSGAAPVPSTTTTTTAPPSTLPPASTTTTTAVPSNGWNFSSAKVKSVTQYDITAKFTAPSNGSNDTYVLNLEIWDAYGKKYQSTGKQTLASGSTGTVSYVLPLTGPTPGAYTVRQGVWTSDWSKKLAGVTQTNSLRVPAPAIDHGPKDPNEDLLDGASFYGINAGAAAKAAEWQSSRPADAAVLQRMANTPTAVWFSGNEPDIGTAVQRVVDAADADDRVPVLVAYNITNRDCGNHSAGGATTEFAYKKWIDGFAASIGTRQAAVIIEPDALSQNCGDTALRLREIRYAVDTFNALPLTSVYLDGGHDKWINPDVMADRLREAGVDKIRGFSVNVAAFATNADSIKYGTAISIALGGKKFVIDTSRNGSGSNGEWCNPLGRSVGAIPTSQTSSNLVDAYLWIKTPGSSDGPCNGGPAAGTFWGSYALDMARRAGW